MDSENNKSDAEEILSEFQKTHEIEEEEIISKVKASNKGNIEKILEEYIEKKNLRKK